MSASRLAHGLLSSTEVERGSFGLTPQHLGLAEGTDFEPVPTVDHLDRTHVGVVADVRTGLVGETAGRTTRRRALGIVDEVVKHGKFLSSLPVCFTPAT